MSFHDSLRAFLNRARAQQMSGPVSDPPPPPPPPTGPDDRQYHADVDEDGDVDYVHSFDVAEHTIAEVQAHVESHPGSESHVLASEQARGASSRSTLIDWLTARLA